MALHSGDVIGGAVNIVLRRDFEGTEARAGGEIPGRKGGRTGNLGALWGGKVGRGHLVIGADVFRRGEIRSADRAYSRASWTEGGAFADTAGVSIGGNTLFIPTAEGTVARHLGDCSGQGYTGILDRPGGYSGTGCGFAYADIAWERGRLDRQSLFASLDYPLDKNAALYFDGRFAQGKTAFRFAPSVGTFTLDSSSNLASTLETQLSQEGITWDRSTPLNVAHRFVGHGNRDWKWDLQEHELTFGLRGNLPAGIGYDFSVRSYRHNGEESGATFVSESLIQAAIDDGRYNLVNPLDENNRQAIRDTGLRLSRDQVFQRRTARVALNGPAFALPGGPLRWAAGIEIDHLERRDIYNYRDVDGASYDPGDVIGSGGTSYSGERLRWSGFAELRLPLHRDWSVALAARRDDHDDVGATYSYQVASAYRLHKMLLLRGSWEVGSRPPGLSSLHASDSISYPNITICDENTGDCDRSQIETVSSGNPALKPDKAQSYSLGAKASLGFLSVSVDWFRTAFSEAPGQLATQKIVDLDAAGQTLPAGAAVHRDGDLITRIDNPLFNSAEGNISGFDIRAGAKWKTGSFDTGIDLRWLHLTESEAKVGGFVQPGDFPRNRIHAAVRAGRGGLNVMWNTHAVSGYSNIDGSGRFRPWIGHDILLNWQDAFGLKGMMLRGGVLNVADRAPSVDSSDPSQADTRFDSVRGRTFFLSLKAKW